ncbi:MAG: hypothetical protein ACW967_01740, partial [Candidatus Hodarchaeales archaeon]
MSEDEKKENSPSDPGKILTNSDFLISKKLRDKLGIEVSNTSDTKSNYINLAREILIKIYEKPELYPEMSSSMYASDIFGIWTMKKIFFNIISQNIDQSHKSFTQEFLSNFDNNNPNSNHEKQFGEFLSEFPPRELLNDEKPESSQIEQYISIQDNKKNILEHLFLIWLISNNPASDSYKQLLGYNIVSEKGFLDNFISDLVKFIENDKQLHVEGQPIIDFLSSPFKTSLTSIKEQLVFIKDHWEEILGNDFIEVVSALDLISEEERFFKMGGLGPGPTQVLDFSGISDSDYEAFTLDSDWMPNVVLLAKTAYVWLNQLSKKYNKSITRLDQIPNEELDEISSRGFNALWLIGVWERSQASKKIKHLCGSLHAEASAYSIYNYNISG